MSAPSSLDNEPEISGSLLKINSSDIVQPEPEILELIEERPAKKLKIESENKEIELETDSGLVIGHMQVVSNIKQGPISSPIKESSKTVPSNGSKQQARNPAVSLRNMSPPQTHISAPKMSNFFEYVHSKPYLIVI